MTPDKLEQNVRAVITCTCTPMHPVAPYGVCMCTHKKAFVALNIRHFLLVEVSLGQALLGVPEEPITG